MEWYEFMEKVYDWSESTIKTKKYQLEEIDSEELEAVMSYIGFERSDQLIRKAIRLKTPITKEIFDDIEEMMSFDVANELREYIGLEKQLNPFENMMKSLDDIDIDQFEQDVISTSMEVERITGVKSPYSNSGLSKNNKILHNNSDDTEWKGFYNSFLSNSDVAMLKKSVFLKPYGSSNEVLEVAAAFEDESLRTTFLTSAHRFGTVFQPDDFQILSKYLKDEKLCDYILISSERKYTKEELKSVEGYVYMEFLLYVGLRRKNIWSRLFPGDNSHLFSAVGSNRYSHRML